MEFANISWFERFVLIETTMDGGTAGELGQDILAFIWRRVEHGSGRRACVGGIIFIFKPYCPSRGKRSPGPCG